jgi:hypothetical protein
VGLAGLCGQNDFNDLTNSGPLLDPSNAVWSLRNGPPSRWLRRGRAGVISVAVPFVLGFSEVAIRTTPRQLAGCGGSEQAAIPIGWASDASFPRGLSTPVSPAGLSNRRRGPTGCTRSSTTDIGCSCAGAALRCACSPDAATTGRIAIRATSWGQGPVPRSADGKAE